MEGGVSSPTRRKYDNTSAPRREIPAEQDWSALDAPADAPWPFTILFVGVDNAQDPDLKLKLEFEKIEQAYRESEIARLTQSRVTIKRLVFARWEDVMMEIRRERLAA